MKKIAIASSLLLAVTGYASAGVAAEGDKWVGGFVEYYSADQEKSGFPSYLDDGFGIGAEVGFRFKPEWAARLELSHLNIDALSPGQDESGNRVGADLMYFLPDDLIYLFGGLKYMKVDESTRMANLGIGKHWFVNDKWRVITEIAAYHDFGEGYNDVSAKLGLAYSFGEPRTPAKPKDSDNDGVYDTQDNCPNTPVGVRVDAMGCNIDSDGDGILNSMDQCPNTPLGTKVDSTGCNEDADFDGVLNTIDMCPDTIPGTPVGAKGCSLLLDTDEDGVLDTLDQCADTPLTDKVDATGCSIFMETEVAVNLRVLFANNSSVISNPADPQFQEFADFMDRFPQTDSVIEGHASAPGEAAYNLMLSEKRAAAVRKLLIDKYGIAAQRLTSIGYGETQLLDTANTREANKINRRITAVVTASQREKVLKN
ncbi:MAG: OOP family OmpA-OmpF porin [Paraglaciecola sp.]|jgi:OOP family OmpA-OmpF porin